MVHPGTHILLLKSGGGTAPLTKISMCCAQGRIQDFLKEGAPTLRFYRTLEPVGTGGV